MLKVFAVRDSKVDCYDKPFVLRSTGEAVRSFVDISNDEQSGICKHPEDFALFELAEYDEESATFKNLPQPKCLGLAKDFKRTHEEVVQRPKAV